MRGLLARPVLIMGWVVLLMLTLYLPERVLFLRVEGNGQIPARYILEKAEGCGISFGINRRQLRSEQIKNRLLEEIPQLQWAGINTYGCVAVISVRERSMIQEYNQEHTVSSIVAQRDGVVQSCTVTRGTAICRVGEVVVKGQVLISGFTDCGLSIRADRAEGEVMALTHRTLKAVTPEKGAVRCEYYPSKKNFSLIIGKIRINFYKDSGILDTTCVKMYSENHLTLPGGLTLPVVLAVEEQLPCSKMDTASGSGEETLTAFATRYLQSQMIAGQILHRQERLEAGSLEGEYACLEMIGQVRYEESITENEDR
jgi:sporulation protein YqfD